VLWTGPTTSNPIWEQLLEGREPDSPVWRAVYDDGTEVQVANRPEDVPIDDASWQSPRAGWFPFVTFTQVVADLIAGFDAPSGFGHNYNLDFVTGWTAVAPADGWTAEHGVRLEQIIGHEDGASSSG
jgi:uncharacterized membrane protein